MTMRIPLRRINKDTRKKEVFDYALVDDRDFDWINQYKWSRTSQGYAHARVGDKTMRMHILIADKHIGKREDGKVLDHINQNKLDNRLCNLRVCTMKENSRNRDRHASDETSKYHGVNYRKDSGNWRVRIKDGEKQYNIGTFRTEVEAAIAYNRAVKEIFGEFASLNEIPQEYKDIEPRMIVPKAPYIGVEKLPGGHFSARAKKNGKRYYLGTFESAVVAAQHYDEFAKKLHGSKAKLNFG